jgi:catechol 2,3-dioxygenase-like lactoylglutathione lyase family enzyme
MSRPAIPWGLNHIKIPATDIEKTKNFHTNILGLEYLPALDHQTKNGDLFAAMLQSPQGSATTHWIEIRLSAVQAEAQKGWDPVTYGVRTKKDLDDWKVFLESKGVTCSRVFTGLQAWVLCALDTDEKIVRLYCDDTHEWTTDFDHDDFWLK